jgi:hypothetical protein
MRKILEQYADETEQELVFFDGHDNAILGIGRQFTKTAVIYNKEIIILNLMTDMSREEAEEFFDFNIAGLYVGEATPIIMDCDFGS